MNTTVVGSTNGLPKSVSLSLDSVMVSVMVGRSSHAFSLNQGSFKYSNYTNNYGI